MNTISVHDIAKQLTNLINFSDISFSGFFGNAWFIGIMSGIASYYIINFLRKVSLTPPESEVIRIANQEVLDLIRQSIYCDLDQNVLTISVIMDNIRIKYGLRKRDMFSIKKYIAIILTEISENRIISENDKKKYFNKISYIIDEYSNLKIKVGYLSGFAIILSWIATIFGIYCAHIFIDPKISDKVVIIFFVIMLLLLLLALKAGGEYIVIIEEKYEKNSFKNSNGALIQSGRSKNKN